jgi:hypothetical protein
LESLSFGSFIHSGFGEKTKHKSILKSQISWKSRTNQSKTKENITKKEEKWLKLYNWMFDIYFFYLGFLIMIICFFASEFSIAFCVSTFPLITF